MKQKDLYFGIAFIFLLGSLFHFTYELSNNNIIISLFSSTNESIFEHTKLIVYPTIIWYIIYYLKNYKDTNKNTLFSSMIINIIISIISIITIFYTIKGLFGNTNLTLDILIFLISIILGIYHANISYKKGIVIPWIIVLILIIAFTTYFTIKPYPIPFFIP